MLLTLRLRAFSPLRAEPRFSSSLENINFPARGLSHEKLLTPGLRTSAPCPETQGQT